MHLQIYTHKQNEREKLYKLQCKTLKHWAGNKVNESNKMTHKNQNKNLWNSNIEQTKMC